MHEIYNVLTSCFCVGTGIYLVTHHKEFQGNTLGKVYRTGMYILGMTILTYGSIQIGYALQNQLQNQAFRFVSCSNSGKWPADEKKILEMLRSCSATRELLENVTKSYEIKSQAVSIRIILPDEAPFGAVSDIIRGKIFISCNATNPISSAVYEVLNLDKRDAFLKVVRDVKKGLDENGFVENMERIEFMNRFEHSEIMKKCIKEIHWPPFVDKFKKWSWEKFWDKVQSSGHTEHYRKIFRNLEPVSKTDQV